jgi:hypothetical protein
MLGERLEVAESGPAAYVYSKCVADVRLNRSKR